MDVVTYAALKTEIDALGGHIEEDVANATEAWLEENVDPDTGYVLDRTLEMSNAAAPADLVGDLKTATVNKMKEVPANENMFDEEHNSVVLSAQYKKGTVYLDGYVGYVDVSTKGVGNYSYITDLHVYNASDEDMGVSFGSASANATRSGKPVNIPSGAVKMEFTYRIKYSGGDLVREVMVTKGNTVPDKYVAYVAGTIFKHSTYITKDEGLFICYVDGTNGDDDASGDEGHPVATIQEAVNRDAENIIVAEGTYARVTIYNKMHPVRIGLKDYSGANKKIKITTSSNEPGVNVVNCLDVTLSDVWVDDVPRHCFNASNVKKIEYINCIASNNDTAAYMGFSVSNSNAFFKNCIAYEMAQDGFNFHDSGSSIMENCVAYNCADDGVSHHDSCRGIIIGGEFYNCGKGGVSSPVYGASVDVTGVYSHDNLYGLYAEGYADAPMSGKVSNCVFLDNSTVDLFAFRGDLKGWNNIYDTLSNADDSYTELTASGT